MTKTNLPHARPKISPLSRTVQKDGWDLHVVIYEDGDGEWGLEISDDTNSATCWLELFETEQQALDEALKTIEENGLDCFYEPRPWLEN